MQVTSLLYRIYAKPGNMCGFLTKKQCVHIASEVGQELADMKKSGIDITREIFEDVIRKKAPGIKMPNIATSEQEMIEFGAKQGYSAEQIRELYQSLNEYDYIACHSELIGGIYVPLEKLVYPELMHAPAHEFQHYLYNIATVKKSFQKWFKAKLKILIGKQKDLEAKQSAKQASVHKPNAVPQESKLEQITESKFDRQMADNKKYSQIETDLQRLFKVNKDGELFIVSTITDNPEIYKKLYKMPKYFTGLTDDKRINAYIRAILRHHLHPKNTENLQKLIALRDLLQDETLAYGVSDKVIVHLLPSQKGTTNAGVISDVYRRVVKILNGEIKTCIVQFGKNQDLASKGLPIKHYQTGLPTSSVVPR